MKELTDNQIYILCHVATCDTRGYLENGMWKYPALYRPSVEKLLRMEFLAFEEWNGDARRLLITDKGCDAIAIALEQWRKSAVKSAEIKYAGIK